MENYNRSCFVIFLFTTALCVTPANGDSLGSLYLRHKPHNDIVIVFVHGLFGDGKTTWTNSQTKFYWPASIIQDENFHGTNIYIHDYPSEVFSSSLSIDELAERMRSHFDAASIDKHNHIIFISHSMGGIISRAFLLKYRKRYEHKIRLMYFAGTPGAGSSLANMVRLLPHEQARDLSTSIKSDYLGHQLRAWLAAQFKFKQRCSYETRKISGFFVVPLASAAMACKDSVDPIDANHVNIVKPSSTGDDSYLGFLGAYKLAMRDRLGDNGQPNCNRKNPPVSCLWQEQ